MNSIRSVLIIGGGQAAASALQSLRQWGFDGSLTLVGDEPFLPYQRPPLSKAYMKGELAEDRLYFKQASWYEDNDIDLVLGTRAVAIEPDMRRVRIEHGGHIDYDALVIASGARPRQLALPGVELGNVHDLRDLADLEHIRPQLVDGRDMVIVGAGYIGLEAAASARHMGVNVTVLEYAPRVLARVTGPVLSEFFEAEHRAHGVDIRTDARLERLVGNAGRVSGARLRDGTVLDADIVLVGIGIVPNEEIAADAGIVCNDGIVVDRDARTSDARVFAAGDCARRPLVHYGRDARLESVHNAIEQGRLAAAAILDRPRPTEDCPWFWSDQYDLKLQIAGISAGFDEVIVRGDPAARKFAVFYLANGRLLATDAVNSPQEFVLSKKLIAGGGRVDTDRLADTSVPFKAVAGG